MVCSLGTSYDNGDLAIHTVLTIIMAFDFIVGRLDLDVTVFAVHLRKSTGSIYSYFYHIASLIGTIGQGSI